MSILDVPALLQALSADAPCGADLEYTPEYIELLQWMRGTPDIEYGKMHQAATGPDWKAVKAGALRLLARSKDLRLAIYLLRAAVALHGYAGLDEALALIEGLVAGYWDHVHPQMDPDDGNDPTERINTLLMLDDRQGLCRDLYAAPLVVSAMHGRYGLRDLDIAAGDLSVPEEEAPSASDIDAAFKNAPFAELAEIADRLARSRDRLDAIVASFIEKLGYGKGAALTELPRLVRRAGDAIQQRMAVHPQRPAETLALSGETDEGAAGTVADPAALSGRDDVARLLDRICEYYAVAEPASPVPILLQRARRLVGLDFMEILADLSPQSLPEIQNLAGPTGS
jgi:type VI secretion system protein ImpA